MYCDRAKQFIPFAALRGYGEYLKEKERTAEPRRELSEDEAEELSRKMNRVKRGQMLRVKYYDKNGYVTIEGMCSGIDTERRTLSLVKTVIPLDSISDISGDVDDKEEG